MKSISHLLAASGVEVQRGRATCPACTGGSRWTVAVNESRGLAYCHRCHRHWTLRGLAREQGITLPTKRIGRAREKKQAFHAWLRTVTADMMAEERRLAHRAELAKQVLAKFPDVEPAWTALAEWYHARRKYELFAEAVRDGIGRLTLYRLWRKCHAAK